MQPLLWFELIQLHLVLSLNLCSYGRLPRPVFSPHAIPKYVSPATQQWYEMPLVSLS